MQAFYSDHFVLPLPPGHRFPMQKYRLLRDAVASSVLGIKLNEAPRATDAQLALAHSADYIERIQSGNLDAIQQKEIGFPWTQQMVERSRRSAGATLAACQAALREGVAVNLAGGTHHAYEDRGGGFCVFNDAAIAARFLQSGFALDGQALSVAIIDLDVHQGNGTAAILQQDANIFTLSLHGEQNYPFHKENSDLDIGLPDGCADDAYLEALERALATLMERFTPDFLIYLAGADPHEGDRLGRLKLTFDGLAKRDQMVLSFARRLRVPIALSMAGGYGRNIADTVAVHLQTIRLAADHHVACRQTEM